MVSNLHTSYDQESARAYADEIIELHTGADGKIKKLPAQQLAAARDKFERNRSQGAPTS